MPDNSILQRENIDLMYLLKPYCVLYKAPFRFFPSLKCDFSDIHLNRRGWGAVHSANVELVGQVLISEVVVCPLESVTSGLVQDSSHSPSLFCSIPLQNWLQFLTMLSKK